MNRKLKESKTILKEKRKEKGTKREKKKSTEY